MTRRLKSIGTLAGFVASALVAWRLGGALGVGVLAGYLLGAGVALWGIEYQRHVANTRPRRAMIAFGLSFLAKFGGLLVGTLVLRFFAELGDRCDWRSFLVTYGFAALLVLLVGMPEVARALLPERALDSRTSS